MRNLKIFFVLFLIGTVSCEIINPAEEIPSYISIESFDFTINSYEQGSISHDIQDVWLSVNGNEVGTFSLPCTVPVMTTGGAQLMVEAGVSGNGYINDRRLYPFYKAYLLDTILPAGEVTHISPSVSYKDECVFHWLEDFEDAGISIVRNQFSDTIISLDRTVSFDGKGSGHISLSKEHAFFYGQSVESFELPNEVADIYLEIHYKSDNGFEIGIIAKPTSENESLIYLKSTDNEWKKLYLDLNYGTIDFQNADSYEIYFQASLQDTLSTGDIYLDNIKVISF